MIFIEFPKRIQSFKFISYSSLDSRTSEKNQDRHKRLFIRNDNFLLKKFGYPFKYRTEIYFFDCKHCEFYSELQPLNGKIRVGKFE